MKTTWTIAKVKDELPQVLVQLGESKHIHTGRVTGRLKDFPTVTVDAIDYNCPVCKRAIKAGGGYLRGLPWQDYQFAWPTITAALNAGHALKA